MFVIDTFDSGSAEQLEDHTPDEGYLWEIDAENEYFVPDGSEVTTPYVVDGRLHKGGGNTPYRFSGPVVERYFAEVDIEIADTHGQFIEDGLENEDIIYFLNNAQQVPSIGFSGEVVRAYVLYQNNDPDALFIAIAFECYYIDAGSRSDGIGFVSPFKVAGFAPFSVRKHRAKIGVEWTDDNVLMYVDGALVGTLSRFPVVDKGSEVLDTVQVWFPGNVGPEYLTYDSFTLGERATFSGSCVINSASTHVLSNGVVIVSGSEISGAVVIDAPLPQVYSVGVVIDAPLLQSLQSGVGIVCNILGVDELEAWVVINALMISTAARHILLPPVLYLNGEAVEIDSASVSFSDGQYAWTCAVVLSSVKDYDRFNADDAFTIDLAGEEYALIVDSKSLTRQDEVTIVPMINGISAVALLNAPRHAPVNKVWPATAAMDIGVELIPALNWGVLSWLVPANTLSGSNKAPVKVAQELVAAVGAILVTDPDGTVSVRYNFPIAVPNYGQVTPDQRYNENDDMLDYRQEELTAEIVNKLRIINAPLDGGTTDSIEFEQDKLKPAKGVLKVYLKPWRAVSVEHTSNNSVSIGAPVTITETATETVEFVGGKGNVSKPVLAITAVTWIYHDLGPVAFDPDDREITTDADEKESLAIISYTSRYLRYPVSAVIGMTVQFVLRDIDGTNPSVVDVYVQRGSGDRMGDDIVDALIGATAVAVQRGRNELDARASGMQDVSVNTVYRTGVRTGQLAEFNDTLTGVSWRGKITGVTHTAARTTQGNMELITALSVQRPTNFYSI